MGTLLRKRIRMQGFIIFDDCGPRWNEFAGAMGDWVKQGRVKIREDIVFGLEDAPVAFIGRLQGRNFGKLVTSGRTAEQRPGGLVSMFGGEQTRSRGAAKVHD